MTITARIIADSISPEGKRITSVEAYYPRFIHSEVMTHKKLSRNASSSRAIPVARMIEMLRNDPAMPEYWGSNKPGMQAGDELTGKDLEKCKEDWLIARDWCIERAEWMVHRGLHKQIANRILEPWAHMRTLLTATCWNNTFALRRHADAQPEFKILADAIHNAMELSEPVKLVPGEWHLPYIHIDDWDDAFHYLKINRVFRSEPSIDEQRELLKKVSVARCARVSYMSTNGTKPSIEDDLKLYERLVGSSPLHASPAEHQATPDDWVGPNVVSPFGMYARPELHGNLVGWRQLRKMLPGEFIEG